MPVGSNERTIGSQRGQRFIQNKESLIEQGLQRASDRRPTAQINET
jgi:hypothetical protein